MRGIGRIRDTGIASAWGPGRIDQWGLSTMDVAAIQAAEKIIDFCPPAEPVCGPAPYCLTDQLSAAAVQQDRINHGLITQ